VEIATYTGLERVLCEACRKVEEAREQVDCSKCETRVCEK
jgi:hypothetical protein